ncbi:hypothetical protein Back11_63060 [Paenibacillus baekrokdamisoli]|uniref:Uncharacterized protein n=1 Tax=Paenibacillus baekrokdamisoli TaxID=1712516 RepID=A0A3G9JGD4_9BACL|nr:hypothetical protein Back11_63060 [Paenibacillus baekrokdamisoli]
MKCDPSPVALLSAIGGVLLHAVISAANITANIHNNALLMFHPYHLKMSS